MQISKVLVGHVFTYGNVLDASAIFLRILQTPEIRELTRMGGRRIKNPKYWDNLQAMVDNIRDYLHEILETKGSRSTANQRSYRTVVAACTGANIVQSRTQAQAAAVLASGFLRACMIFDSVQLCILYDCRKFTDVTYDEGSKTDVNSKRNLVPDT